MCDFLTPAALYCFRRKSGRSYVTSPWISTCITHKWHHSVFCSPRKKLMSEQKKNKTSLLAICVFQWKRSDKIYWQAFRNEVLHHFSRISTRLLSLSDALHSARGSNPGWPIVPPIPVYHWSACINLPGNTNCATDPKQHMRYRPNTNLSSFCFHA